MFAIRCKQIVGCRSSNSQITKQFGIWLKQSATARHAVGGELRAGKLNLHIRSHIRGIYNRIHIIQRGFVASNVLVADIVPVVPIDVRRGGDSATRAAIHTKVEVERAGYCFCISQAEQTYSRRKKK